MLVSAVFICFPNAIADIFFHEPKAVATAVGYLVIIGFSEAFMCVELTTIGALSGLGRTRLCSVISIVLTGARIPLAIVLSGIMGAYVHVDREGNYIYMHVFLDHERKKRVNRQCGRMI